MGPPGGDGLYVESIAALKAQDPTTFVQGYVGNVAGYYAIGDGGGGQFWYDAASATADNLGTVIEPNNGIGRWKRFYSGALSVKWFGAKGDGVTVDTTRIQAALNVGDTFIPEGTFMTGTVTVGTGRSLTGIGFNSILKAITNLNTWVIQNTTLVGGNTGVNIAFLTVDGNKANQSVAATCYGIYFSRVTDGFVTRVTMQNCKEDGFLAGSSAGGTTCIGIYVRHCVTRGCDRNGLAAVACTDSEFSHNAIYGSGAATENAGIDLEPNSATQNVARFRLIGNQVSGYGSATIGAVGIVVDNTQAATCEDFLLSGNIVTSCGGNGLQVSNGVVGAVLEDNIVVGCGVRTTSVNYGIFVNVSAGTKLAGNKVRNHGNATSAGTGLFILLSDSVSACDNTVERSFGAGVSVRGSRRGNYDGNTCSNNGRATANTYSGIELVTSGGIVPSSNSFTGNKCYDDLGGAGDQKYGIDCTNSTLNTFVGNDLRGNRTGALNNTSTDDIIRANSGVNPLGYWATSPAVPATTVAATNTSSNDCMVAIYGGTDLVIIVGGTGTTSGALTAAATQGYFVIVGAGQTITLAYTVAPTWRWFRL